MKRSAIILFSTLIALFLPTVSYSAIVDVGMSGFSFFPQTVTINVGDTVRWINNDFGYFEVLHTTTSGTNCTPDGKWDSGLLPGAQSYSVTFDTPGSYPYYCASHCTLYRMVGTVAVSPPTLPLPAAPLAFPPYSGIDSPLFSPEPALARPVGIGPVATGGDNLEIRISTGNFPAPVDMYFAVSAPALTPEIFLLTPTGLQPLSTVGLVKWKSGVNSADEDPLGAIPVSLLPPATYNFFLAITPADSVGSLYLWQTSFVKSL